MFVNFVVAEPFAYMHHKSWVYKIHEIEKSVCLYWEETSSNASISVCPSSWFWLDRLERVIVLLIQRQDSY